MVVLGGSKLTRPRPFLLPVPQILKTVAQLSAGLDHSKDEEGAAVGPGDIVETEHPSILPNRPNYKLYHTALPKASSSR